SSANAAAWMGRSNINRKPSVLSISRPRCCSTSARARRSCLRMMLAAFWSPMRSTSAVESAMSHTTSVRSCGVAMRPGPGAVSNWWISAVMGLPWRVPALAPLPPGEAAVGRARSAGVRVRKSCQPDLRETRTLIRRFAPPSPGGRRGNPDPGSPLRGVRDDDKLFRHSDFSPFRRKPEPSDFGPGTTTTKISARADIFSSAHHMHAVAAGTLDVVQRAIRFAVPDRPLAVVAAQAAADADGHREVRRAFGEAQLAHAFDDALRAFGQLVLVLHLGQKRELVAAKPARKVGGARGVLDFRRDRAQHVVTQKMPGLVVDLLEAVDVDQQQAEAAMAIAHLGGIFEELVKATAIAQPGQVVGAHLPARELQ